MVRDDYQINFRLVDQNGFIKKPIFALGGDADDSIDLRGGQALRSGHTIQWDWFLDMGSPGGGFPQLARKFNRKLGAGVRNIATPEGPTHLGVVNLLRGWRMGLPSGSAIADFMGISNAMAPDEHIDDCLCALITN